jgi:hypothetical protein
LLAEYVFEKPVYGQRCMFKKPLFAVNAAYTWAVPIPSPIINIIFLVFGGWGLLSVLQESNITIVTNRNINFIISLQVIFKQNKYKPTKLLVLLKQKYERKPTEK